MSLTFLLCVISFRLFSRKPATTAVQYRTVQSPQQPPNGTCPSWLYIRCHGNCSVSQPTQQLLPPPPTPPTSNGCTDGSKTDCASQTPTPPNTGGNENTNNNGGGSAAQMVVQTAVVAIVVAVVTIVEEDKIQSRRVMTGG